MRSGSLLAIVGLAWPLFHLVLYVLVVRRNARARSERGIFSWHAGSYGALALVCLLLLSIDGQQAVLAAAVLSLCAYGIYSLTFLELWSLCQGSYSLQLLTTIAHNGGGEDEQVAALESSARIGTGKLSERLDALRDLRLIDRESGLTGRGRALALLLSLLIRLSAGRSVNR